MQFLGTLRTRGSAALYLAGWQRLNPDTYARAFPPVLRDSLNYITIPTHFAVCDVEESIQGNVYLQLSQSDCSRLVFACKDVADNLVHIHFLNRDVVDG